MIIFDVEANGLVEDATKIHCFSYLDGDNMKTLYHYDDMRELLTNTKGMVGHNIVRYDVPLLNKILGIKIKTRVFDTLPMSWVLNPTRSKHGLDSFFPDFGIEKPKIDNWENLSKEDYTYRCEQDVRITKALWDNLLKKILETLWH